MGVPLMPYFVNPGHVQPINLTGGNNQPIVMNAVVQPVPADAQEPAAAAQVAERGIGLVENGLDLFYKAIRIIFILCVSFLIDEVTFF